MEQRKMMIMNMKNKEIEQFNVKLDPFEVKLEKFELDLGEDDE